MLDNKDMQDHYKRAVLLTELLDNKFKILGFSFGLDPVLGLIPGGGDVISLIISLYMIWIGSKMNVPDKDLRKMVGNVIIDFGIGLVPFVGDIADFYIKANMKNIAILKKYLNEDIIEGEIIS